VRPEFERISDGWRAGRTQHRALLGDAALTAEPATARADADRHCLDMACAARAVVGSWRELALCHRVAKKTDTTGVTA